VPLVVVKVGAVIGVFVIFAWGPAPAEFTALTLKVWVPAVKSLKIWLVVLPTDVQPPLFRATSYLMIAAPPLLAGACQLSVTWVAPGTALRLRGAPGTVAGVVNISSLL